MVEYFSDLNFLFFDSQTLARRVILADVIDIKNKIVQKKETERKAPVCIVGDGDCTFCDKECNSNESEIIQLKG